MHIRLPDKHNVANHFCLQGFLSEKKFSTFAHVFLILYSIDYAVILLFFKVS